MKVILGFNDIRKDGMGTAALTLVRALKSQNINVVAVHAYRHMDFPEYERAVQPKFVEGNSDYSMKGDALERIVNTVNALAEDGDVFIHFGSPNWAACIPYVKHSLRVVVAVHSTNPSTGKLCCAYAPRISGWVCISKGVMELFKKRLPKKYHSKITLIPNAVEDAGVEKKNYALGEPLRMVFVGRIEDTSKGCGKLPKILAELKRRNISVMLDLYGYFHDWETQFWTAVDKAGVRDTVNYRGEVNHEDIPQIITQYDLFIAPSNFEGFGLSLAEAMMTGLPCLISRIKNVTDWIIQDGEMGMLADKMNIQQFANQIERLVKTPGMAERIGKAGRVRIRNLASFAGHGEKYAKLVHDVSASSDYEIIVPHCDLKHYVVPECVKSWGPARLLPTWLKTWLRRFMT